MPNPSYQKGYRFEKKCQAWLCHLGECIRSAMSKGDDLTLTRNLRRWTFSCKVREKSICKLIDAELETHDAFIWQQDRGVPIVAMPLPKLVEFVADPATPEGGWSMTLMCEECGLHPADAPGRLCPGCYAYREHTA